MKLRELGPEKQKKLIFHFPTEVFHESEFFFRNISLGTKYFSCLKVSNQSDPSRLCGSPQYNYIMIINILVIIHVFFFFPMG